MALKCDDECLRLQRNRKLAEALNIDPATHSDDHIPYSDTTLKLFRSQVNWAKQQERELRVFAATPEEKRLRFKPMPSQQRAFLHALAEDFGLDSESQDPEPHRHVCIFKTPKFVAAPQKTLDQCLRIATVASNLGTGASALKPLVGPAPQPEQPHHFNALLLKDPRFGLTIEELDAALATELAVASRSGPALTFTTSFLPSDEVLIKAVQVLTAAAVATSLAATPQAVETTLSALKAAVTKTVSRLRLAGAVLLCHVDATQTIVRREGDAAANNGGWSAVASRGSWRRTLNKGRAAAPAAAATEQRAPSTFVALRRLGDKKKAEAAAKEEEAKVEEDWLSAVEREEIGAGSGSEGGSEDDGAVNDGVLDSVSTGEAGSVQEEGKEAGEGEENKETDETGEVEVNETGETDETQSKEVARKGEETHENNEPQEVEQSAAEM